MTTLSPRRRDVRERLLALHEILNSMVTNVGAGDCISIAGFDMGPPNNDYDRDFLNNVRDALRAGDDLEGAVLGGVDEMEEEDEDEAPEHAPEFDTIKEYTDYMDRLQEEANAEAAYKDYLRRIGDRSPSPRGY